MAIFGHYGGPEPRFELLFRSLTAHFEGPGSRWDHFWSILVVQRLVLDNPRPIIGVKELDLGPSLGPRA